MATTELAIRPRMNDLPDEIVHIADSYIPLSRLLTRLAQSTHNALQAKVVELSNLPLPMSAMNGNGASGSHAPDDVTVDNLKKKSIMLNFIQDMHTQWVKAYVIADWSRKAEMVSKLIDLKFHLDQQRHKYNMALDHSIHMKQSLAYAQLRSPDIKTGYQILSTGGASFMPDLNYVEPPALPSNELAKCITELDTSLSLRLSVDEYDKIPPQFCDYTIASGRVTFRAKGEFEVDLTIADEDPDSQFWFIDFRFAFAPAAEEIPDSIRIYLEFLANKALAENGLTGCYQFLHEFVLSHKINELRRQALQLNRGLWAGSLKVEPLQRVLAIQYWASRTPQPDQMPKHWIMIGVNSDQVHAPMDPVSTSSLVLKWYRDGQEVRDANIPLDLENLSVEDVLLDVIGKHTHHILSTVYSKFAAAPGFKEPQSRELLLTPPETNPKDMSFSVPVGAESRVALSVEPITGALHLEPQSRLLQAEDKRLNMSKNTVEDGVACLEQSRWRILADVFARKAACCSWAYTKPPLTNEIIKSHVRIRDRQCTLFFQRHGWRQDWYIMMLLSPAGDSCWAVQASRGQGSFARLAIDISHTDPGMAFWGNLDVLATGIMTQVNIKRSMLQRGANIKSDDTLVETVPGLPQEMPVPVVLAKLSDLIPSLSSKMGTEVDADAGFTASAQFHGLGNAADSNALRMAQLELTLPMAKGADAKLGNGVTHPPSFKGQNKPWLYDMVRVAFKGFQLRPQSSQSTAGHFVTGPPPQSSGAPMPLCVSKVTIRALNPDFFKFINYKPLGGDVVYSLKHGEFVFGVYHEMGTTIIDTVIARVRAIDRLVDFIEAMNHVPSGIKYTSIKLDEVKFTYPDTRSAAHTTSSAAAAPAQPASPAQRWPVTFDLSGAAIRVSLDHNDPHAPLTDVLSTLVNSSNGISSLMKWLPVTLDLCAAITSITREWATMPLTHPPPPSLPPPPPPPTQTAPKPKGKKPQKPPAPPPSWHPNFTVEINSLDWLTLRYDVALSSAAARRTVCFHANILYHEPTPWWHVAYVSGDFARTTTGPATASANDDPVAAALRQLCDDASVPFRPMGTALAARPSRGTAEMIMMLDERVKGLMIKPPVPQMTTPRVDAPIVVLD